MAYLSPCIHLMIKRFTYKELTLILGIIVALIVVFTLWIRQPSQSVSGSARLPKLTNFVPVKSHVIQHAATVFVERLSGRNNPY